MEQSFIYVLPFLSLLSLNAVNEFNILEVFSLYLAIWRDI